MELKELGVTPAKEKQFNHKNIFTIEDLLRFLPYRYNDLSKLTGLIPDKTKISCLLARVDSVQCNYLSNTPYVQAKCTAEGGKEPLQVTWFRQTYLATELRMLEGETVFVAGKASWNDRFQHYSIANPEVFVQYIGPSCLKIQPIYSKISGMSPAYLESKIEKALERLVLVQEPFPSDIVSQYTAVSIQDALKALHQPASMAEVEQAKFRLAQDDMLYFAACNAWNQRNYPVGSSFAFRTLKLYYSVLESLPYELTRDQMEAVNGMLDHIRAGRRLNALVQGDVGCGKTIVAILMAAAMAGGGYQVALMAPTQVLARQHFEEIQTILAPNDTNVLYLGADMKAAEKREALMKIASGEAQIVVGTTSVLGKDVRFKSLALIITDEEHKFGVAQRNALLERSALGVHSITMSATPIPRSLAQVIFGDHMQLYTIETMPAGRKPVVTGLATTKEKLYRFIIKEAAQGHQTYVVCPTIDKSEKMEGVSSVEEVAEDFRKALSPHGVEVVALSGKDTKAYTQEVIESFKEGKTPVLVSTTVIEVGVNVPTATTMVIMNAERFGLAALHQLRGRVGRSNLRSFCVLASSSTDEEAMERLNILVNHSSGFEIAREDLRLRGAGDFVGTRQSGDNKYLPLVMAYPDEYAKLQKVAENLIDKYGADPWLQ